MCEVTRERKSASGGDSLFCGEAAKQGSSNAELRKVDTELRCPMDIRLGSKNTVTQRRSIDSFSRSALFAKPVLRPSTFDTRVTRNPDYYGHRRQ
jgi:hypothetical protein